MSWSNSASSTSTDSLTLFPSTGESSSELLHKRRSERAGHRPSDARCGASRLDRADWWRCRSWKPHALAKPHADQLDLRIGDQVRATVDLHGVPAGTEGKVILANGFNWQRYRVLFDNGVELGDLDDRQIEPIGRAAKRLPRPAEAVSRPDPRAGPHASLRHRFPGLVDGWARFDGPAGTQMVDVAITRWPTWIAERPTTPDAGGPFAAADACDALLDRARATVGRAVRRRPGRRRASAPT